MDLSVRRAWFPLAKRVRSSGAAAHEQIGTPEQNMKSIHVFGNTAVDRFSIAEIPFYDQKGVFDFAANG